MSNAYFHSKDVISNQDGIHKHLVSVVGKHMRSPFLKPIRAHNQKAFLELKQAIQNTAGPLIMDSCCGTGMSTRLLARQNPDALIIGIDQSFKRLNKQHGEAEPENCLFLQANCEDIWTLCNQEQIKFAHHYILYPNPWPKSEHLKRRWHGHPRFVELEALSKDIELRSNWRGYLEEFHIAWKLLTRKELQLTKVTITSPLTLFEKKYSASGQTLYRLCST